MEVGGGRDDVNGFFSISLFRIFVSCLQAQKKSEIENCKYIFRKKHIVKNYVITLTTAVKDKVPWYHFIKYYIIKTL
jgi:hypothetical protein